MKKVLIITRAFYPNTAAGSHRVAKTAAYLPLHEWEPIVVAPQWTSANAGNFYDPALQDTITAQQLLVPYAPDHTDGNASLATKLKARLFPHCYPPALKRDLYQRAAAYLKQNPVDVIYASAPPTLCLDVAAKLSKQFNIPWVADLRDIPDEFSQRPNWHERRHVTVQTSICQSASALITVSPPIAQRLMTRQPQPIYVVYNGFDAQDYPPVVPKSSATFDIIYAGILVSERNPKPLFTALDKILEQKQVDIRKLRVCFYGSQQDVLARYLAGHHCADQVFNFPRVPYQQSVKLQQNASVLLMLTHRHGIGVMTSKIFEYLAARRPILNIPGDHDCVDELIEQTHAGVSLEHPDKIADQILHWYQQWREQGVTEYQGQSVLIDNFSRQYQTSRVAQILDSVLSLSQCH